MASASGSSVPGLTISMAIIAPRAPDIADGRMRGLQRNPGGWQIGLPDPTGGTGQPEGAHGVDGGEGGGAGHRVAAVGPSQPAGVDRVHQLGPTGDRGQRHASGQRLGRGEQVGRHTLVLAGEPVTGPAEAGLDLVGGQHHAVLSAPGGQGGQEPGAGTTNPPSPWIGSMSTQATLSAPMLLDLLERPGCAASSRSSHRGPGTGRTWEPGRSPARRARTLPVGHVLGGEGHGQVGTAVVGVVEDHHGLSAGGVAGDLDGVLHGLGTRVEQRGALGLVARRRAG